jgi:hypothetical protein
MIKIRKIIKFLFTVQLIGGFVAAFQYAIISSHQVYPKPSLGTNLLSLCTSIDCTTHGACLNCRFPTNCKYDDNIIVNCTTNPVCERPVSLKKEARCRFCWQTDPNEHECNVVRNCSTIDLQVNSMLKHKYKSI